uniref:Uncharacterized protein n=1 Tax=Castor canadensis TaxID=51338 RepID=A0A8C0XIY7_CASCN
MESKPSRIPRRISVQSSSSLSARMMSGSRGSSFNDTYHSRDSSFRMNTEYQCYHELMYSMNAGDMLSELKCNRRSGKW